MNSRNVWMVAAIALAACGGEASTPMTLPGAAGSGATLPPTGTSPSANTGSSAQNAGVPSGMTSGANTPTMGTNQPPAKPSGTAGGGATPTTNPMQTAGMNNTPPNSDDPMACRGFSFDNIKYSPGGNVLPNKCMPYHPTTNNPYAVRCVDVWPWYKTKYPGDNFCILPPPPEKGLQYGVHPQGRKWFEQVSKGDMSGYENLSTEWTMMDGEEEQANYNTNAENTMPANYYRNYARMRPGSHHMIVSTMDSSQATEKWGPATGTGLVGGTSLPGAQRPDENTPKSIDKPAEDAGLFAKLPATPNIMFNMHHFNASGQTILKEAWTNLWFEEDAKTEVKGILGLDTTQVITMAIQPGSIQDLHYSWNITQPIRLVTVFGHRHAWTTNFSAWVENPDGKLDIVYQSFQWLDEPTYRYDSMTMNPVPATPPMRTDGASSGIRMLMPGQKFHFNCHIEFTDARAASEKAPKPAEVGTLRFANEAFTGEMCILFGSTAATQLSTPTADSSKLPDFAAK